MRSVSSRFANRLALIFLARGPVLLKTMARMKNGTKKKMTTKMRTKTGKMMMMTITTKMRTTRKTMRTGKTRKMTKMI